MSTTRTPPKALTSLDARVESATGWSIDALWETGVHAEEGLADVVAAHRVLADAERGVTFYRTLLHRLSNGEFEVENALFQRIDRTVAQLQDAAAQRDERAAELLRTLKPFEERNRPRLTPTGADLLQADYAALVAIAPGGAVLREHLLTHRMSVTTPSGNRITWSAFQRLETQGLVNRDITRPLHTGQPITLTDAGRACLTRTRQTTPAVQTVPTAAPVAAQTAQPRRR
ncbi:hypothetical protein [Streptomyces nondiastaticus]|uniref:MarR family transcriptional regulator n=1 Tax=Streptomyces nondiastaticus TaxID=3154512 RepID=A0ABW6TRR5_9ACTN